MKKKISKEILGIIEKEKKIPAFSGLKYFLKIAIPLIISQTTDNIMFFMDRLFLSNYGDQGNLYLNASLIGALTVYSSCFLFISIINYTNAIISQYYGSGKFIQCSKVCFQGIILSLVFFPSVILISFFYPEIFSFFGHEVEQLQLELEYSNLLVYGSFLLLIRSALNGFFSGIGKTKVIMVTHFLGMLLNIPLNYLLIFGVGPFPEWGITGAAVASIIAFLFMDIILIILYFSKSFHRTYQTRSTIRYYLPYLKKLLKYGVPAGVEGTLGLSVFTFFILSMNGYGPDIGTAVTIAINWDSMFFIPMLGISFSTTVIVGQHLGKKQLTEVKNTLKLALSVTTSYAILLIVIILVFPDYLIDPFLNSTNQHLYEFTYLLLKLVCLYVVLDGFQLVVIGVLRGAGDTRAVMIILISIHSVFGFLVYFLIYQKMITPIQAWIVFIGFVFTIAIGLFLRYLQGGWMKINLIDNPD